MNDYEELSDEEYAAEMGRAFDAGELEYLSLDDGKTWAPTKTIFHSAFKDRRYRRKPKPKPRRITGHLAILPVRDFTSLIYCFYATGEEIPEDTKSWVFIPIDQEVPE
jgi:hypothetical protein